MLFRPAILTLFGVLLFESSAVVAQTVAERGQTSAASDTAPAEATALEAPRPTADIIHDIESRIAAGSAFSPEELSAALLEVAAVDSVPERLLETARSTPGIAAALGPKLLNTVETRLRNTSSVSLGGLRRLGVSVLRPDDENLQQLARLFVLSEEIERSFEKGDIDAALRVRDGRLSSRARELVEVKTELLLQQLVIRAIRDGEYQKALQYLSKFRRERFTDEIMSLARTALQGVVDQMQRQGFTSAEQWPFDDDAVFKLVEELEKRDIKLKLALAELFSTRSLYLLHMNDVDGAKRYFLRTVSRRIDPSPENDQLRLSIALSADSEDAFLFAHGRVEELKQSDTVGLGSKFRLLMKGYYGKKFPFLLKSSLVFLFVVIVIYLFKPRLALPGVFDGSLLEGFEKSNQRRKPFGRKLRGYDRVVEGDDEYSQLLATFGLEDDATDAEIKQAYRQLVKDCHPDSVGGAEPEKVQRFQELKKAHDRVFQIRKSLFGR